MEAQRRDRMAFEGVHVRDWEVGLKGRVTEASKKEWINIKKKGWPKQLETNGRGINSPYVDKNH